MSRRERRLAGELAGEPAAADAGRRFRDADGVNWLVREREAAGSPPALYFETEMAFRRVTHYPLDWRDLPTAELEILSHAT
jgi:hypothetical protein